jgi:hypothetical protein
MAERTPPFGRFTEKGRLETDVRECAVTGSPTESGDPMVRIQGTPLFYRVRAHIWHHLTDQQVAALEKRIVEAGSAASASRSRITTKEGDVSHGSLG